ncbi:hypothetical protein AB0P44_46175, partial [Streptomyces chartreusis]|uniref:hypothetical protein n=1 Tax=Streptomyces chartreusis TaxID=1969 RepID=UPI0034256FE8
MANGTSRSGGDHRQPGCKVASSASTPPRSRVSERSARSAAATFSTAGQSGAYAYLGAGYGSSGWMGLANGEYRFKGQMDEVA